MSIIHRGRRRAVNKRATDIRMHERRAQVPGSHTAEKPASPDTIGACISAYPSCRVSRSQERVSRSHTQRPRVLSRLTSCSPTCCSLRVVHSSPPPQSLYLSDCSARPLARAVLSARCGPPVLPRSDRSTPCGRGRVPRPRSFVARWRPHPTSGHID